MKEARVAPRDTPKDIVARMHRELGLRHYSRSDFIVSPKGIYYLETNTLPGMTGESLLPKALAAVGVRDEAEGGVAEDRTAVVGHRRVARPNLRR